MLTKQQLGYVFENHIHQIITLTYYPVLTEKEIVNKYSRLSFGIDHLIYLPDYIICIQDKWRDTKSPLSDINHFIKCVENIYIRENYKKCIGIYLSKMPITEGAQQSFSFENSKGLCYFISLHDEYINRLINKLTNLFYSNNIFFYEPDGSAIMNCS